MKPVHGNASENKLKRGRILASYHGAGKGARLSELCRSLVGEQHESWQRLKDAYEALRRLKTRAVPLAASSVFLYHNPGRLASATAPVGPKDVKERPCFLCLENLPAEQKWVLYRDEYRILCNPLPLFSHHLTIAHVNHRPQGIAESFDTFLALAADLGEEWVVLYNGPRCGASAPDHLHLQALPAGKLPVEGDLRKKATLGLISRRDDAALWSARALGRQALILNGSRPEAIGHMFSRLLAILRNTCGADDEPMMNLTGFYDRGSWVVALFPRQKHRPDVFFREGEERILVSPGAVEMAGVLVTPVERDFHRLDPASVAEIYREVSMDENVFAEVLRGMTAPSSTDS